MKRIDPATMSVLHAEATSKSEELEKHILAMYTAHDADDHKAFKGAYGSAESRARYFDKLYSGLAVSTV
jgi:hypothetical protein